MKNETKKIKSLSELTVICKKHAGCTMVRIGITRYLEPLSPDSKNLGQICFEIPPPQETYTLGSNITLRDVVLECAKQGIFFNSPRNNEEIEKWLGKTNLPKPTKNPPEQSPEQKEKVLRDISSQDEYILALEENFPNFELKEAFLDGASSVSEAVRSLIKKIQNGEVDDLSVGTVECLLLPGISVKEMLKILFKFTLEEDRYVDEMREIYKDPHGNRWIAEYEWEIPTLYRDPL